MFEENINTYNLYLIYEQVKVVVDRIEELDSQIKYGMLPPERKSNAEAQRDKALRHLMRVIIAIANEPEDTDN